MVDKERQSLITYLYKKDKSEFIQDSTIPVFEGEGYYIKDVMLLDLDQDGLLDAVVVGTKGNHKHVIRFIFNTNQRFDISKSQHKSLNVFKHIPNPFQIFDDEDGLLKNYLLVQITEEARKVVSFTNEKQIMIESFQSFQNPKCKSPPSYPLSTQFGGAFIDLNMDCRPDLLVESYSIFGRSHELYIFTDEGFCFSKMLSVPENFSMVSFMDVSQRGSNDAVFLTNGMELHIFRNKHFLGNEGRKLDTFDQNFLNNNIDLCIKKELDNPGDYWPFQDYTKSQINDVSWLQYS